MIAWHLNELNWTKQAIETTRYVILLILSTQPTLCPKKRPPFYFSNNSVKN